MKVAITGGNGHIGSTIIDELLQRGFEIKALAHKKQDFLKTRPVEIVTGSLHDADAINQLLDGCDYLIHCAAAISITPDTKGIVHNTNVNGLKNVLEVAKNHPLKRIVHLSSVHAYNHNPSDQILAEVSPFVSDDSYAYDKSKRDGQLLTREYVKQGLPIVVVNPTAVFGPPNFVRCKQNSAFISMAKRRMPFVFKGGYNWVDVRDVTNSICNALTQGEVGESYILGGKYYTLKELSNAVGEATNKKLLCFALPSGLIKAFLPIIGTYYKIAKQDPSVTKQSIEILVTANQHISSEKAMQHLGHNPRPIVETMKDLLQWEKEYLKK